MNKKNNYAISNEEGPVMFDGTVFKSQKELVNALGIGTICVGVIICLSGFIAFGIILAVFGLFATLGSKLNKKEVKK